jgi:hypothetical protein
MGGRVVECARLESVFTQKVTRVRIPPHPLVFLTTIFMGRKFFARNLKSIFHAKSICAACEVDADFPPFRKISAVAVNSVETWARIRERLESLAADTF